MKIYITEGNDKIENYNTIKLENFQDEMKEVINNSCTEVVAHNVIDKIKSVDIEKFVTILCSKLRIGGKIIITGTDLGTLSRGVINNTISSQDYSSIIENKASLNYMHNINAMLKKFNLTIDSGLIRGTNYEIIANR
jgi:hypothetical protein